MNGLPAIANNLAAKGRYGDSMLMHVSPGEVKGLQSLAMANGGSLTINPDTGLPEAFKLKDILPAIAGFALGPAGFALMSAPMAGLAVGGVEALRTKDLGRGLMAGLGAYGGAGLGQAAMGAGSQAAMTGEVAKQAAGTSAAQMGTQAGADAILQAGATPATTLGRMQMAGQGIANLGQAGGLSNFGTSLGQAFPSTMGKTAAAMGLTAPLMQTQPMALPTPEDPYANYKGPYTPTERQVRYPSMEELMSSREFNYFSPSNPVPFADGGDVDRSVKAPGADYVAGTAPEFNYNFRPVEIAKAASAAPAAIGGKGGPFRLISRMLGVPENNIVGYTAGGDPIYSRNPTQSAITDPTMRGILGRFRGETTELTDMSGYKYDPMTQQLVKMAKGGSVPQLEDGGFVLTKKAVDGLGKGSNKRGQHAAAMGLGALPIKGKGHGTSDSIKTTIDGKVPARVSNGEAYIPRSNVQRAGGAKKLYALMKKAERKA